MNFLINLIISDFVEINLNTVKLFFELVHR